jgi:hypothetical protein
LNCREPGPEPKVVDNFKFDNEDLFFVMQYKPGNWAGGSPTGGIALDPSPERRWVSIDFVTAVGSGSVKVTML